MHERLDGECEVRWSGLSFHVRAERFVDGLARAIRRDLRALDPRVQVAAPLLALTIAGVGGALVLAQLLRE